MRQAFLGGVWLIAALVAVPAMAQSARDSGLASLSGLRDQAPAGRLRCPDGSTRPWDGERPGKLVVDMACAIPAAEAERRHAIAAVHVAAKAEAARQEAALRGEQGVASGLAATAETGRLDYLLRFRIVWIAAVVGALALVGAILGRLLGGK